MAATNQETDGNAGSTDEFPEKTIKGPIPSQDRTARKKGDPVRKRRRKRKRRPAGKRTGKHWAVFKAERELDRAFDLAVERENT